MSSVAWHGFLRGVGASLIILAVAILIFAIPMWTWPKWGVYRARLHGQAELAQAEFNRRIAVVTAEAERDAAGARKQAAITRAEGIAEANHIIGKSITPQYIQWLWVEGLSEGKNEVIYVPTEANLPILEAMRKKAEAEAGK